MSLYAYLPFFLLIFNISLKAQNIDSFALNISQALINSEEKLVVDLFFNPSKDGAEIIATQLGIRLSNDIYQENKFEGVDTISKKIYSAFINLKNVKEVQGLICSNLKYKGHQLEEFFDPRLKVRYIKGKINLISSTDQKSLSIIIKEAVLSGNKWKISSMDLE